MGALIADAFGIVTTKDCFQSIEIRPDLIDKLNSFVTEEAMLVAVYFNIVHETTSGPVALHFDRLYRKKLLNLFNGASQPLQQSTGYHWTEENEMC